MRRIWGISGVVAGLGLGALAVGPASGASAQDGATVWADDGGHAIHYAGGDAANDVTITSTYHDDGTEDFVIDDVVPITAGTGCVHPDPADTTRVMCTLTEWGDYWVNVDVDLGGGDDALVLDAGDANSVDGGDGDDRLDTPLGDGITEGGAGDDWLRGGFWLRGGPGNDTLEPYGTDAEAYGDDGNDLLVDTDNRAQSLYGGRGDDVIEAGDGNDTVYGNSGADEIRGGRGDDSLFGGPDNDVIYGNSGNDELHGGPGTDQLSGGPGDDLVYQD